MKLVAYLRVSTETQAVDGLGLDVQRKGIRQWARANGHRVVLWTSDAGVSGSNGIETRKGLLEALNALRDGTAEGLVVYRLDRLARSLTVQESALAKVWGLDEEAKNRERTARRMFSVDLGEIHPDDPDDPMRTALRQMVGVFAQLERGMIAARMRAGRREKAERGGYAQGAPPFGYKAQGGNLVREEREAATLARIIELRSSGASLNVIANRLNAEGLRPKRSERWHSETVRRVVAGWKERDRSCSLELRARRVCTDDDRRASDGTRTPLRGGASRGGARSRPGRCLLAPRPRLGAHRGRVRRNRLLDRVERLVAA